MIENHAVSRFRPLFLLCHKPLDRFRCEFVRDRDSLSTLPANISRRALVNATKLRWRIERDYQDLKQG